MKSKEQMKALFVASIFATTYLTGHSVKAAESADTKISNASEDVKADAKKSARSMKRAGRKITGTDTAAKDTKDKLNDTKDNVERDVKKTKNKIQN